MSQTVFGYKAELALYDEDGQKLMIENPFKLVEYTLELDMDEIADAINDARSRGRWSLPILRNAPGQGWRVEG